MQKRMRQLSALCLCVLMVFSFAACGEVEAPQTQIPSPPEYMPESALELWEKINETMDALDSMEMTISTQKVYYSAGYRYEQNTQSYVLSTHEAHYTESESKLACQELALEQTINMVEAYYDGKMYRGITDGRYDQKFCSPMSHEDYDGLQSGSLTGEVGIADCTNATFSKSKDGLWQLSFESYTKKTIDQALAALGLSESAMGAPIADMQVRLTANEKFQVTEMQITFVFASEGESAPAFSVHTVYSGWNTASFDESRLNAAEYTQVEDVYLLDAISAAIIQRQNAPLGQFTLETRTTEHFQNQTRSSQEKGVMIYGLKNNAYCYFFTANTEGKSFIVRYQNGEQTVISNGQSYTAATSEAEARAYINGLIDSAKYNPLSVTGMEKREDGSYLLTIENPDVAGYVEGVEVTAASQQIVVSFTDGDLTRLESRLTIEGTYEEETLLLQTDSLVMFTEITEFPDN